MDWRSIKVFPLPDVGNSFLRVNVRGREPDGIVEPGAEYEALLNRLEHELKLLINPETNEGPVERISFPQREFDGPMRESLPDVCVVWSDRAPIRALESLSIGRIEGSHWEQRSGNHSNAGAIVVSGPNFATGGLRSGDLRELAPTLLTLHGVPVPQHYELHAMAELIQRLA